MGTRMVALVVHDVGGALIGVAGFLPAPFPLASIVAGIMFMLTGTTLAVRNPWDRAHGRAPHGAEGCE